MPRMTFYVFDLEGSRETLGGYRFGGNTDSRRRPHPLVAQFKRRGTLGRGTPVDPPPLRAFVCRPPAPGAVFQADARECRAGGLGRENTPGTRPSRDPGQIGRATCRGRGAVTGCAGPLREASGSG